MSVVRDVCTGWIISHKQFIDDIYKCVLKDSYTMGYRIKSRLFDIGKPYKVIGKRLKVQDRKKRKHDCDDIEIEDEFVKKMFDKAICNVHMGNSKNYNISTDDNNEAKILAEDILMQSAILQTLKSNGGNNSEYSIQCVVIENDVILPPNCRFFSGCVKDILPTLKSNSYNFVCLDPPWWNKYIRRVKAKAPDKCYPMMFNAEIASLPISDLLSSDAIVAVWCTNSPNHIESIKNEFFPSWGVNHVATWFWIKVTNNFDPICPFGSNHSKKPYERILFGIKGSILTLPSDKLIISIPSAIHSHKPPLTDIIRRFAPSLELNFLEIFARYLLPNTTSVGYEPLRLQHISLYEPFSL